MQVLCQRHDVEEDVKGRDKYQGGVVARRYQQGHDQEPGGADHQVDARIEHQVDLSHIVRGPGHGVPHRLQAMKGHAFAQQADIKLVPNISFGALADQLSAEISTQLQDAPQQLRRQDQQRRPYQYLRLWWLRQDAIERLANEYRDGRRQQGIAECANEHDDPKMPVPERVRNQPAFSALSVGAVALG